LLFDEPVCALGLRAVLEDESRAVVSCATEAQLMSEAVARRPQVVIYSAALDPDLALLAELRRTTPLSAVVLWGRDFAADYAHQAIEAGARGFLSAAAEAESIRECMECSVAGQLWMERSLSSALLNSRPVPLSRRQSQLLALLMQGLKNREIASAMGISEGTVKTYLTILFEKVGARDRFELALFGLKTLRNTVEAEGDRDVRLKAPLRSRMRATTRSVA
jgi:two-component system, NarL family, nitrate/nitrite response regulator NarL